jgi:cobalamin biosynthesis Mg chelatase CobN
MQVQNHASVDLYVDEVLRHAKVILMSLHGGIGYWRYGVERLVELSERGVQLILVPGDDRPDPELSDLSTVPAEERDRSGSFCARAAWAMRWASSLPGQPLAGRATTPGRAKRCRARRLPPQTAPPE